MKLPIVTFIANVLLSGALASNARGNSITRTKTNEYIILPPDVTNRVLEDNGLKRLAERLPQRHLDCLTGQDSSCTKTMAGIKRTLKKAMLEDCATCTEQEKRSAGTVLSSLLFFHPAEWRRMLTRYHALDRYQAYLNSD